MVQKRRNERKKSSTVSTKVIGSKYIDSSYTVVRKDDVKIYNPSVVSTRKRVISA